MVNEALGKHLIDAPPYCYLARVVIGGRKNSLTKPFRTNPVYDFILGNKQSSLP